jgi:hypothetical protein
MRFQFSIDGTFHFEVEGEETAEATIAKAKRFLARLDNGENFERSLGAVNYAHFSPSGADTDFEPTLSAFDGEGNDITEALAGGLL